MQKQTAKRPWLTEVLTRVALSTRLGSLAAAYGVSRRLTRPTRGRPAATPAEYGLPCEPLHCRTADGHRLAGWAVAPPRPHATLALFHGIRHNRGKVLDRIAFLAAAGYRCVAFDHRAHGESGGRLSSFGYHEGRDVASVLDLVRTRWPAQPYAALGISMGAAALCYAADHARHCSAVVLESCYHDIASAFESRLQHAYPPWFKRLSRDVIWLTERRLGLRLHQLSPADHIGRLAPAPVLLLTGTDDHHAPPHEVQDLYDRCRGPRELWFVPRATHKDIVEKGGAAYRQRILQFLDRWLSESEAAPLAPVVSESR